MPFWLMACAAQRLLDQYHSTQMISYFANVLKKEWEQYTLSSSVIASEEKESLSGAEEFAREVAIQRAMQDISTGW